MERFLRLSVAPVCVATIAAITLLWPTPDRAPSTTELDSNQNRDGARKQLSHSATAQARLPSQSQGKGRSEDNLGELTSIGAMPENYRSLLNDRGTPELHSTPQPAWSPSQEPGSLNLEAPMELAKADAQPLRTLDSADLVPSPADSGNLPNYSSFPYEDEPVAQKEEPTFSAPSTSESADSNESSFPAFNAPNSTDTMGAISDDASADAAFSPSMIPQRAIENENNLPALPVSQSDQAYNNLSLPNQPLPIETEIAPEQSIGIENAVGAEAGSESIEVVKVELNPAILEQIRLQMEKGNELARKGALFGARTEYQNALYSLANARDAQLGQGQAYRSLDAAWRAISEADDFVDGEEANRLQMELGDIIARHQTRVIDLAEASQLTRFQAMQRYLEFAQRQLVIAAGLEPVASEALFGLGKIHIMPQGLATQGEKMVAAKAIVLFQAALQTNPEHARAASELGTQFAKIGELQAARDLFVQSLMTRKTPVTWRNLAIVHQRLGEHDLAQQAMNEAMIAEQQGPDQAASAAIQLVPNQQFEANGAPSLSPGFNQPAMQQPAPNVTQPQVFPPRDGRVDSASRQSPTGNYGNTNQRGWNSWQR